MAPALVEHSAAKERNSISKEYSNIRSCLSQFDIDLLDKFRHQYSLNSFETDSVKESNLLEMNNSDKEKKEDNFAEKSIYFLQKEGSPMIKPKLHEFSVCDAKKLACINGSLSLRLREVPSSENLTSNEYLSKCETTKQCNMDTPEDRSPQPVATLGNSSLKDFFQTKRESCILKLFDLNLSMSKLNSRLRQLQFKNVASHVSNHIHILDNLKSQMASKSPEKIEREKIFATGITVRKSWGELKKIHDMVSFTSGDTVSVDDLEVRCMYVNKSKKKYDNVPPPDSLHQWKIKRAFVGSQCSWLSLKISSLDEKINHLDELLVKCRLERKKTRSSLSLPSNDDIYLNISEEQNEIDLTPHLEEQICRRVLPHSSKHRHTYINSSLANDIHIYKCRCFPSVNSCYLCIHLEKYSIKDSQKERTGKLDLCFHHLLSYENDVSLSFLLEETLRKQRINTKVTISKPTRKKKKQNAKDNIVNNDVSRKDHAGSKHASTSDENHLRWKVDKIYQLKYGVPQKRSTVLDSSGYAGRSRKIRKLSESDESWKPSTPTDLSSPYSHSLSTSAFFPIKQRKKNIYGGDYDIDNIVIPYSMAAATRVERIQYKEIPTPGWRNVYQTGNGLTDPEEFELTEDEAYLERHTRCEVSEKKKFTDYFQPVIRRRSYHPSESTASGPPSPLLNEDVRIYTPVDSPINLSTNNGRIVNVTLVPEEERQPCWSIRTYPLDQTECKNLHVINHSSVSTVTDMLTATKPYCALYDLDTSKYCISTRYLNSSSNASDTPVCTPTWTPMPSPLCSPGGTPSEMDDKDNDYVNKVAITTQGGY